MEYIISQILGAIALALVCVSYFVKKKSIFLIVQIVANIFYAGSFLFVYAYGACVITLISTVRCLYIYFCEKYNFKYSACFMPVFIAGYITTGILLWKTNFDFMPILSSSLFTVAFFIKDLKLVRYFLIPPNAIIMTYAFLCKNYAIGLLDAMEIVVLVAAIIKFYIEDKKETQEEKETKKLIKIIKAFDD